MALSTIYCGRSFFCHASDCCEDMVILVWGYHKWTRIRRSINKNVEVSNALIRFTCMCISGGQGYHMDTQLEPEVGDNMVESDIETQVLVWTHLWNWRLGSYGCIDGAGSMA